MAKFDKKPLPRGTKLYGDGVMGPMSDIATSLSNKNIDEENYKRDSIPWRMTFCPTNLSYKTFYDSTNALAFPFTLPPPQELWSSVGQQSYDQVALTLEEIAFSIDLRQEPAAVSATSTTNKLHGAAEVNELELVICEKQQWFFNNNLETHTPERILFSRTFFADDFASMNYPFFQSDLNITLDPYKTYAVHIRCPKLNQENNAYTVDFQLASPTVSLRGNWTRLPNTANDEEVASNHPDCQNVPLVASSDASQTVTVSTPAGGANISANSIDANVAVLDDVLLNKIEGGYGPNSEMGRYGHTLKTMGYDIIAVPLMTTADGQGFRSAVGENYETLTRGPYFTGAADNFLYDRVVLPIQFPMEIHHVFCSWSLQSPFDGANAPAVHPTATTTRWQVGVSLGSGIKSDYVAYNQVAALEFSVDPADPSYYQNFLIDRYRVKEFGDRMSAGGTTDPKWDAALLSVPLMYLAGDAEAIGNGYYTQGKPVFAGRGNSWTGWKDGAGSTYSNSRRSKLPHYDASTPPNQAAATNFPNTFGLENFLEVAVRIQETGGATLQGQADDVALSGQGGFWVYLVVKRASVQNNERLR